MRLFFRRALLTLSFLTVLMPSFLALPASAANVQFHCWCQDTTTRTCDHQVIDSGILDAADTAVAAVAPMGLGLVDNLLAVGALRAGGALFDAYSGRPAVQAALPELAARCVRGCTDGGKKAIHFETSYREEICHECNPSTASSCTEAMSGRLAFGAAQVQEQIAQCKSRQAETNLLPIHLAVPIGGIDQVNGLPDYINIAYRYMVTIVLVVAIVMVVYGGFRYLVGASMGDIQAGKKIIQDAIVGMLIVLGAYTILSTVNQATTVLSFKSPATINCQDLAIPSLIKNAHCSGDAECGAGKRCVLAKNILTISTSNITKSADAGSLQGGSIGASVDAAGGVVDSVAGAVGIESASGKTALTIGAAVVAAPLGALGLVAVLGGSALDQVTAAVGGYEVGGSVLGVGGGAAVGTYMELQRTANFKVCSTGEQGAPCVVDKPPGVLPSSRLGLAAQLAADATCKSPLVCVGSWGMCWTNSGNAPGMPCTEDAQCANQKCVDVTGTDYRVCEIVVQNGTPCLYPEGSQTTVFPMQCNGNNATGLDFMCVYCEPTAKIWMSLLSGVPSRGQCKPKAAPNVLGTSCASVPAP